MNPRLWRPLRRLLATGLLAAGSLAGAEPPANGKLVAVRFWSLGEVTRVAIETDAEVKYHAERIENPDRLFVDLASVRPTVRRKGIETIAVGDRLLKQIRVAETLPGKTRVVLDLAGPAEYTISQLRLPDRLIVELRTSAKTPAVPAAQSASGHQDLRDDEEEDAPPPPAKEAEPVKPPVARVPAPLPQAKVVEVSKPAETPRTPETVKPAPLLDEPKGEATMAQRTSRGDQSLIRALGLKLSRVVIDPGHGGHDTGTIGPGGLEEKTLVLDVALRLGALIEKRLGSEVVYTRSEDVFIPLETRTALANQKQADLFLSIHANSSRVANIAGSETFYLNLTTEAGALDVAARENASSEKSIHELEDLVKKITLSEKVQESREFASSVQNALYTGLSKGRAGIKNRGVKKAPFVVLIGAHMPSVLAEIAFLSNPREEKMLRKPEYRQRIAEAIFKGLSRYASTLSHFQVASEAASSR